MKKNQIHSLLSFIIFTAVWILLWTLPQEVSSAQQAARLGDTTAHGGVIVAGCSTVLIGGKPAARVGDMHTCPMMNPGRAPTPHTGGPIIMGSPTVLIGGMPAARVGDMAVCSGPPDSIILGCPTVLIGGGAAGQSQKYSEDYIQSRYDKSVVITEKEFQRTKIKKKR